MLTLKYAQVISDTVYIDSRVYCRDIINVGHSDWMTNVLKKYQETLESRFGTIRFENGSKTQESGRVQPNPETYALLTEAQCNFALVLSRNTPETMERKADLIADFERAKASLKSQLESQFNQLAPAPDTAKIDELTKLLKEWEAKYKQVYDKMQYHQARAMGNDMLTRFKESPEAFTEDSEILWLISGIADKHYFVSRCREDLAYGVDFINGSRKGTLKLTPHAALLMLLNLRSRKGVQARYLPETVEVTIKMSIGHDVAKMNKRKMQQR